MQKAASAGQPAAGHFVPSIFKRRLAAHLPGYQGWLPSRTAPRARRTPGPPPSVHIAAAPTHACRCHPRPPCSRQPSPSAACTQNTDDKCSFKSHVFCCAVPMAGGKQLPDMLADAILILCSPRPALLLPAQQTLTQQQAAAALSSDNHLRDHAVAPLTGCRLRPLNLLLPSPGGGNYIRYSVSVILATRSSTPRL